MQLLLVDDERDFVHALAQRLELRGMHCTLAYDADSALQALQSQPHMDMAFLDVNLPGMDGVQLLQILRERYPALDVVMLSGATDLHIAVQAMKRGAVNWLPKPVDGEALMHECQRSVERQRQRRRDAQLAEAALMRSLGCVAEGVAHEVNNPVNIMTQAAGWVEDLLEDAIRDYALQEAQLAPPQGQAGHAGQAGNPATPPHQVQPHLQAQPPLQAHSPHPPWAEMREALRSIRTQSLRVREITRRLLVFGKGMDAVDAPIDVALVLQKAVDMLSGQAAQAGVCFELDIDPSLPWPSGSAVELHQACVHVLENALEAMPTGGRVHISTRLREAIAAASPALLLHFSDTGPGIAEDVLPHIFEPFFSTKDKGAGLGLAVCQSLLLRRQGTVVAENCAQGARLTLTLPLDRA